MTPEELRSADFEAHVEDDNGAAHFTIHYEDRKIDLWVSPRGAGRIETNMKASDEDSECDGSLQHYNTGIAALESVLLTHACAGVEILAGEYLAGFFTALDALNNNLGG